MKRRRGDHCSEVWWAGGTGEGETASQDGGQDCCSRAVAAAPLHPCTLRSSRRSAKARPSSTHHLLSLAKGVLPFTGEP